MSKEFTFDLSKPFAPAVAEVPQEPTTLVEISPPEKVRETPPLAPFPGDRFSDAAALYWLEKFPPRPHPLYSIGEVPRAEYYESPSGKASKWAADSIIFQLHLLGEDSIWILRRSGRAFYDLQKAAFVSRDETGTERFLISIFDLRKKLDAKIIELGLDGDALDAWTHTPHSSEESSSLDTQKIRRFHKVPGGIQ